MKIKNGRKTITSEIAYLAGFFDGEGCIRIKKPTTGNTFHVIAHVTNTNKLVLDKYVDLFGGKVRKQEKGVNKAVYNYYITCSEAVDMLKILNVFLIEKRNQASYAILFHEEKGGLSFEQKMDCHDRISEMKKEVIGNIYESPELLNG